MRIALAHNLRVTDDVTEVVFTSRETLGSLIHSVSRMGHDVVPVELSGPVVEMVERLETAAPDLVFNVAEGWSDGARQPFFTALYAQLGLPFTGSGPYAQSTALDKHATKLVARECGVRTPRWQFVRRPEELNVSTIDLPALVKPNFEGTSRGITRASIVSTETDALAQVKALLAEYPAGALVEEYLPGCDLTVPYLAAVDNGHGGVLDATEVVVDGVADSGDEYPILDFHLKNAAHRSPDTPLRTVSFRTPAGLSEDILSELQRAALATVRAVGCADIARVDFRLGADGRPYLLEVNALPGLDPGLSIHRAAEFAGLHPTDGVAQAVVAAAVRRYGLDRA